MSTTNIWARMMQWGRAELTLLIILLIVVSGVWGFIELADEVIEGETQMIDERILLALRNPQDPTDPLGPPWVEEMGRDLTALGGLAILTLLTGGVAGYLVLSHKYALATLVVVAVMGGSLLSLLLKAEFERPRPDLVPHGMYVYNASFPSGHSMGAAATYLTLGALLARVQSRRRLKIYFILVAMLLTFLVGLSRIYLGVHWPTDVLAGWTAGALWALICWLVTWWLQARGQVEDVAEVAEPVVARASK